MLCYLWCLNYSFKYIFNKPTFEAKMSPKLLLIANPGNNLL